MNDLTQQGVVALKSGNKIRARNLLKAALRQDPHDLDAWLWLSGAVETDVERIDCLENVLRLDPANKAASRGYTQLTGKEWRTAEPPAPDVVPPPAMIPMAEGAPPAALAQLSGDADEILAPAEPDAEAVELPAAEAELAEPMELEAEAELPEVEVPLRESLEEAAPELPTLGDEPLVPAFGIDEPAAEAALVEEEPRIKSWEELLGPSEVDEPSVRAEVFGDQDEEVSDTQEVRIGKPGSSLKFVTGPSLRYGVLKLVLLLAVFAGLIAAVYYFTTITPLYIIVAAVVLAIIWLALLLVSILGSSSNRYTLTRDKLLIESGLVGKKQTTLALTDIEEVQSSRSLMQKIGGAGDILIKTKDNGEPLRLQNVGRFKERLQELEDAVL